MPTTELMDHYVMICEVTEEQTSISGYKEFESLVFDNGLQLKVAELFILYQAWCVKLNEVPKMGEFTKHMAYLFDHLGRESK